MARLFAGGGVGGDLASRLRRLDVLTTGEMARVCRVAPRTVTEWCEAGLLKHYRIPGGRDRRIRKGDAVRFLRENDMPLHELASERPLLLCLSGAEGLAGRLQDVVGGFWEVRGHGSMVHAVMDMVRSSPDVALADWSSVPAGDCRSLVEAARSGGAVAVGLASDDFSPDDLVDLGCRWAFRWPQDGVGFGLRMAEALREALR